MKTQESQVLITPEKDNFIIAKKFSSIESGAIGIISPFIKDGDFYDSNIQLPGNRSYRVQSFYELTNKIAEYTVNDEHVWIDCVNKIPQSTFNNIEHGIIHFDYRSTKFNRENPEENVIFVKKRMLLEYVKEPYSFEIETEVSSINFTTNLIKAFPIILKNGFMLSIIENNKALLYFTCINPNNSLVGFCIPSAGNLINKLITPIWDIFNINTESKDQLGVFINENFNEHILKFDQNILVKMERDLDNPNIIDSKIIAVS